jgi:hypothetical protein
MVEGTAGTVIVGVVSRAAQGALERGTTRRTYRKMTGMNSKQSDVGKRRHPIHPRPLTWLTFRVTAFLVATGIAAPCQQG